MSAKSGKSMTLIESVEREYTHTIEHYISKNVDTLHNVLTENFIYKMLTQVLSAHSMSLKQIYL